MLRWPVTVRRGLAGDDRGRHGVVYASASRTPSAADGRFVCSQPGLQSSLDRLAAWKPAVTTERRPTFPGRCLPQPGGRAGAPLGVPLTLPSSMQACRSSYSSPAWCGDLSTSLRWGNPRRVVFPWRPFQLSADTVARRPDSGIGLLRPRRWSAAMVLGAASCGCGEACRTGIPWWMMPALTTDHVPDEAAASVWISFWRNN